MSAGGRRIARRLIEDHGADLDPDLDYAAERASYSEAQRRNGGWSWNLTTPNGRPTRYGSQWSTTAVLRCANWQIAPNSIGDIHVDPCGECPRETAR